MEPSFQAIVVCILKAGWTPGRIMRSLRRLIAADAKGKCRGRGAARARTRHDARGEGVLVCPCSRRHNKACNREQPLNDSRFLRRPASFARAAGIEGLQMPRRRFNRTRLSPYDLAICERVFDQVCADEHIDPLSRDAEALAMTIVAIFRNITTNERELLEEVRSLRRSKGAEKEH